MWARLTTAERDVGNKLHDFSLFLRSIAEYHTGIDNLLNLIDFSAPTTARIILFKEFMRINISYVEIEETHEKKAEKSSQ